MTKPIIDVSNLDLPIAAEIRELLNALAAEEKRELLEEMTEDEFIDYRVDIYLEQLEAALLSGVYSHAGAEEIAREEAMGGLRN